ncbi:exocyst complex component Sec5 [Histoplasma capsulatum H143]|uniref:Exocyst complex component SEC5 n=1 Tax=Ajellomyces capsulatus (strain H143) TaxID=544712 RepID=C6HFU2_AJECH|nr:exocyst complex component Sec5 [Histoplasma capsulatum H143]
MASYDTDVTQYYNIPSLYPEEWPAELNESDDSDGEDPLSSGPSTSASQRRKSRYAALQRGGSDRRSIVPGSQRTGDGRDNLVQKDEPDPLGSSDSVVRMLKQRGIADDDARVRNRYLLSSTTFSPALFLSQTHSSDSIQSLLEGLEFLSRSIDQKSASLKVLVESNFERFVRAKATIDNVYTEMRNQGAQPDAHPQGWLSQRTSVSGSHMKGSSIGVTERSIPQKNSLTKESEYGVKGIRVPLAEALGKVEEVWGAALGGRQREEGLKAIIEAMSTHREIYEIGSNLVQSIKQRDYEAVVDQYTRARRHAIDARLIADRATASKRPLSDEQVHLILVTGRMWIDVEKQIQVFKRDLWRRLSTIQANIPSMSVDGGPIEEHMELIATLLELGVDDNPVWVWLLGRYDFLKTKITAFCERSKVEIEILRRRLANGDKPTPQAVAPYIQRTNRDGVANSKDPLDTELVIELWEMCPYRHPGEEKHGRTSPSGLPAMSPISSGGSTYDKLKLLVSGTRERSVRAVCAAWNKDAEGVKYLEDWTRDSERKDMTKMPGLFVAFESAVLSGMQKILYISEAMTKPGIVDVVTPPPAKLLQMVRSQFVTSVYKALSGLVENAEHPVATEGENEWILLGPVVRIGGLDISSSIPSLGGIDAKNRNVRMLLTLSNLKALRTEYVPQLVSNFETAFSVKLTEESKTIRDVLGQIDTRLFQSYTRPMTATLNSTILNGITAPDWVPLTSRPDQCIRKCLQLSQPQPKIRQTHPHRPLQMHFFLIS